VLVSGWGRGRRKKNQRGRGLRGLLGEEIDLGFVFFFLSKLAPLSFVDPPVLSCEPIFIGKMLFDPQN